MLNTKDKIFFLGLSIVILGCLVAFYKILVFENELEKERKSLQQQQLDITNQIERLRSLYNKEMLKAFGEIHEKLQKSLNQKVDDAMQKNDKDSRMYARELLQCKKEIQDYVADSLASYQKKQAQEIEQAINTKTEEIRNIREKELPENTNENPEAGLTIDAQENYNTVSTEGQDIQEEKESDQYLKKILAAVGTLLCCLEPQLASIVIPALEIFGISQDVVEQVERVSSIENQKPGWGILFSKSEDEIDTPTSSTTESETASNEEWEIPTKITTEESKEFYPLVGPDGQKYFRNHQQKSQLKKFLLQQGLDSQWKEMERLPVRD